MGMFKDWHENRIADASNTIEEELLPGTYEGGITHYLIRMDEGTTYSPKQYADKVVVVSFGKGRGYITDTKDAYNIEEISFYFPEFNKTPYTIHAITALECVLSVVRLNEWDQKLYEHTRDRLPLFRTFSKCSRIDEDFRTPGTVSRDVLGPHQLGRIAVGAVFAQNKNGTMANKDPYAIQWLYFTGQTDAVFTKGGLTRAVKSGEFIAIAPGEEYSIFSKEGTEAGFIWIKHFTRERDFKINPMPTKFNH